MNLFDRLNETFGQINARRLGKQAREQEQQPGAAAGRYNPTLGARDITTADGGTIAGAKSITGAGVGQDTPVQITQSGRGAIYDFKNPRATGDLVSANSAQERGGKVGSGGLGGAGTGTGGDAGPVTGYVPQPDGTCSVVVARSLSELPTGAFATAQECLESTRSRGFVCVEGECVETTDAEGRWRSRAECEAALVPAGFTGGQCEGRLYNIILSYTASGIPRNFLLNNFIGPISSIEIVRIPHPTAAWQGYFTITHQPGVYTHGDFFADAPPSLSIVTGDGNPDNCGDPPPRCPG